MSDYLSALEEFDAQRKIQFPHLLLSARDIAARKKMAYVVLAKKEDEIVLIEAGGFSEPTVLAGLSEKSIEYFAKNAPKEYRETLLGALSDEGIVSQVWEIAKAMDEDFSENSNQHQQRIRNVFKYIRDNQRVFHF